MHIIVKPILNWRFPSLSFPCSKLLIQGVSWWTGFNTPACDILMAGGVWLKNPIDTMCQLELSLPAYIIRGTFILSALRCFRHYCTIIALNTWVMASTIFSGLNRSFSFLFSWRTLFKYTFIMAISVAWALILFCQICCSCPQQCPYFYQPQVFLGLPLCIFLCCQTSLQVDPGIE